MLVGIAALSRKILSFLKEYKSQSKLYVDMNVTPVLALFSNTLLQIMLCWFLTISSAILEVMLITVFSLISAPGDYWSLKLLRGALNRGRRISKGSTYFEVRELNNIKCQNRVIFSFKIRMKHTFSLSMNQNILKKSKYQQYFHCFIVCIQASFAFWFSY